MNYHGKLILLLAAMGLVATPLARADSINSITINTAALAGSNLTVDLQFVDGSGAGDGNNSVTLANFNLGTGGSIVAGSAAVTGGAVGDLSRAVVMQDSNFFNDFQESFVAGSSLSFSLDATTNVDTGGTPDEFSVALLDGNGNEIPTTAPNSAFATLDLNSSLPAVQTANSSDGKVTATASVLKPTKWVLDGVTLADGGAVNGSVLVDYTANGNTLTKAPVNWAVAVSGGTVPGFDFTPSDSSASITGDPLFDLLQDDPAHLSFSTNALPPTGGAVTITSGSYSFNSASTLITAGGLDGTAPVTTPVTTPEPATWVLLLGGLLALGGAKRSLLVGENRG